MRLIGKRISPIAEIARKPSANGAAVPVKATASESKEDQTQNTGHKRKTGYDQPAIRIEFFDCCFECPDLQKTKKPEEENKFWDMNENSVGVSIVGAMN